MSDAARQEQQPGAQPLRRLVHLVALVPLLAGLALLPLFLTHQLAGGWATPTYIALVSTTVLVGSLAARDSHPIVPLTALATLVGAGLWLRARAPIPLPGAEELASAWRFSAPAGGGLPGWWPVAIAIPAGLVVLVETIRRQPAWPGPPGGGLEGLPSRPALFGLTAILVGVAGTLFAGSTFLEKVAVVAPIFEELAKLGLALLVMAALGLSRPAPAFALGATSGMTFGLLEHAVTYSTETVAMYVVRVFFHALAAGLSALVYVHLRRREGLAPGAAWFAIAPSALVHAANNVTAVGVAIVEIFTPGSLEAVSPLFGLVFVLTLVGLTVWTLVDPDGVCGRIDGWWTRLNGLGEKAAYRPRRWR